MPLSIEEVKKNKEKKDEEKEKVVEFFKEQEEDGKTDFFSSEEVSQGTGISVKSVADILEMIHLDTVARYPIEFQNEGQIIRMRLWKVEEKGIFYYGATFYRLSQGDILQKE